ncbi:MAG: hypothetical protein KIS90_05725 [Phenylobacterium sp.]|nr:hypothetical protein [Phenylobacterium sp.]
MLRWVSGIAVAVAACGLVAGGVALWPLHQAKRVVAAQLRDPDAAKFRSVRRVGDHVCGEFNGKNAFGAYAGFKRFIVDEREGVVSEPELSPVARGFREAVRGVSPGEVRTLEDAQKAARSTSLPAEVEQASIADIRAAGEELSRHWDFENLWISRCSQ